MEIFVINILCMYTLTHLCCSTVSLQNYQYTIDTLNIFFPILFTTLNVIISWPVKMCVVIFIVTLHYEFICFVSIIILCAFVFVLLRNRSNF